MSYISTRQNAKASSTGGNVTLEPYASNNQSTTSNTLGQNETEAIPAGKYEVVVYNDGLTNITVNGANLPTGNRLSFVARENPVTQRLDLTPEVVVVTPNTSGASASFYYTEPSA